MQWVTAGWRLATDDGVGADGRPRMEIRPEPGLSLFETIERSGLPDEASYVIHRTELSFVILNIYPYTTGHVMVLPKRAAPRLFDLSDAEYTDLWSLVRTAYGAVRHAFEPDGMNIGLNEGTAGGASEPDHLHVHVVPRWAADTNFMTSVAEARVLPITLRESWQRVRSAWPDALPSNE